MATAEVPRGLTAEQLTMLLTPLNPNRVKEHKGNAHLEAWDVRRWLTRIFGFAGWDDDILSIECIHSVTSPIGNDPAPLKHRCTAVYRVTMRLTVKDQWGNVLGHWDDGATGEGVNQVSVGDAHDLALKAALSQALKRCAVNLCDQFGLSLYNKGDVRGVVVRTLGHPVLTAGAPDPTQDAPVVGGELDEQSEALSPEPSVREPEPAKPRGAQRSKPSAPAQDEWSKPASDSPRMMTDGQSKALHALLTQKKGRLSDDERHAGFSAFTKRKITSASQLTYQEASALLDFLGRMPDFISPGVEYALTHSAEEVAEANARGQAQQLAATDPESDPDRVESDLRDQIEGAENPAALEGALTRARSAAAAGAIGKAALSLLEQAGKQRTDQLAADRGWSHERLAAAGLAP